MVKVTSNEGRGTPVRRSLSRPDTFIREGGRDELFKEAKRYMAGGVNSPVRSFKAVGGEPIFVNRAEGSKIYSEDGREFIDYCLSWGAMILGHAHLEVITALLEAVKKGTSFGTATKLEIKLAELITEAMPSIEKIRLTNSGTEAVMGAIRLARAFTKKDKIIKFKNAYHGGADYLLDCPGVPKDFTKHTIIVPYNDIVKVEEAVKRYRDEVAAIIVEPVSANYGVVLPKDGFLQSLRKIADEYKIVLIFDEVITGFRISYNGAQGHFGLKPDLTSLGKIIGGGLPVGAFGGRRDIMELLSPEGNVYQAGTFSGNPATVTAGLATLKILKEEDPYRELARRTRELCEKIKETAINLKIVLKVNYIGSIFSLFFTDSEVTDFKTAKTQDSRLFKNFFHGLLENGIYFSPSGFEANFLSTAHTKKDVDKTLTAINKALKSY